MSPVALKSVFLHVTKACNLRCAYCYFSADRALPDEMQTHDFERLWPDLVLLGPRKVVFTGGEPLLRPDLFDLLGSLRAADSEQRVLRCLNTNGHLMTPEVARRLVGLADEVRVSIDGMRERNDSLRGRGNFDAALRALECLHEAGFEPIALVTVTRVSLPDLEDLVELLVRRSVSRINLNPFRPIGRGREHRDWGADASRIAAAVRRGWERCYPDRPALSPAIQPETQDHCGAGSYLNILPNGDVFPCHELIDREFHCGNVRATRLLEICRRQGLLGHLQALDFRELSRRDPEMKELVRFGTCMARVHSQTRDHPAWKDLAGQNRQPTEKVSP